MNNIIENIITTIPEKIMTKNDLIETIKKWNILDTNLKIVGEKTRKIRDMKNYLADQICSTLFTEDEMKTIDPTKLKNKTITMNDGEIRFYEKKEYSPLSFTYIESCLGDILEDESQIDFIMDYLRDNREITSNIDIKKIDKKKIFS
jgi:hypothetical protein